MSSAAATELSGALGTSTKGKKGSKFMSKKHVYVLGINAYDHDVSACLLRDGEIAFAISKERITRKKARHRFLSDGRRLLSGGGGHLAWTTSIW